MPRVITALGGQEATDSQIPVSLVELLIPGATRRIHDLDVSLYLNTSTGAVSLYPGAGLVEFVPYAGLTVPQIEIADDAPLSAVNIQVANVKDPAGGADGEWFAIVAANAYQDAPVTIWQGNITLAAGVSPFAATFTGVLKSWAGQIDFLEVTRQRASLDLGPPLHPFTAKIPRRKYTRPRFKNMKKAGEKFIFGYTEEVG